MAEGGQSGVSRAFAVSGKDRGAITMAGHDADGTFWWDDTLGGFTTYVPAGTTAEARLAPVTAYNAAAVRRVEEEGADLDAARSALPCRRRAAQVRVMTVDHEVPPLGWIAPPAGRTSSVDPFFQSWLRASPMYDQLSARPRGAADRQPAARPRPRSRPAGDQPQRDRLRRPSLRQRQPRAVRQPRPSRRGARRLPDQARPRSRCRCVVVLTADHGSIDAAERLAERGFPAHRVDGKACSRRSAQRWPPTSALTANPLAGDPYEITIITPGGGRGAARADQRGDRRRLRERPEVSPSSPVPRRSPPCRRRASRSTS